MTTALCNIRHFRPCRTAADAQLVSSGRNIRPYRDNVQKVGLSVLKGHSACH